MTEPAASSPRAVIRRRGVHPVEGRFEPPDVCGLTGLWLPGSAPSPAGGTATAEEDAGPGAAEGEPLGARSCGGTDDVAEGFGEDPGSCDGAVPGAVVGGAEGSPGAGSVLPFPPPGAGPDGEGEGAAPVPPLSGMRWLSTRMRVLSAPAKLRLTSALDRRVLSSRRLSCPLCTGIIAEIPNAVSRSAKSVHEEPSPVSASVFDRLTSGASISIHTVSVP